MVYNPPEDYGEDDLAEDIDEVYVAGDVPLAAGLHRDGTLHIYVHGKDSGVSVGLEADDTLWVRVDESKRAMRVTS